MTFTNEDEKILKLIAAELKTRMKLDIENQIMGNKIRTEFRTIDQRIRVEHTPIFTPLQEAHKTAQDNIRKEFE